LRLEENIEKKS